MRRQRERKRLIDRRMICYGFCFGGKHVERRALLCVCVLLQRYGFGCSSLIVSYRFLRVIDSRRYFFFRRFIKMSDRCASDVCFAIVQVFDNVAFYTLKKFCTTHLSSYFLTTHQLTPHVPSPPNKRPKNKG